MGLVGEKFLKKKKNLIKAASTVGVACKRNALIKFSRRLHSASSLALKVDLKLPAF